MRHSLLAAALLMMAGAANAQPTPSGPPGLDANNDRVITRQEFDGANAERFEHMDRNHDGRLAEDEFSRPPGGPRGRGRDGGDEPPPPMHRPPRVFFPDANDDGAVTRTEFLTDAENRFGDLDRDHNGRITREEADASGPPGPPPPRP